MQKKTSKTKELNNTLGTIAAIMLAIFLCMCADSIGGNLPVENDTLNPINSNSQNY